MNTIATEKEFRDAIASTWWIPLIQGITAILFGLYAFTRTGSTMAAIIIILGAYWISNGLFTVISAITGKTERSRLWQLIGGALSIIAGLFALSHPFISGIATASFIATLIGISAVISGIVQMIAGRELMDIAGYDWSWGSFFFGLLNMIFGFIVLGSPLFSFALFVRIMAIWTIFGGFILLYAAFRIRSMASK